MGGEGNREAEVEHRGVKMNGWWSGEVGVGGVARRHGDGAASATIGDEDDTRTIGWAMGCRGSVWVPLGVSPGLFVAGLYVGRFLGVLLANARASQSTARGAPTSWASRWGLLQVHVSTRSTHHTRTQ